MDRESLFVFANNIGACITYMMIEAIRPHKTTVNLKKRDTDKKLDIGGRYKDDTARKWLEKSINPQSVLHEFEKMVCVKRGLRKYSDLADPFDPLFSFHEMDKENFTKLTEAFANTYPDIFEKLEIIRKGLGLEIDEENKKFLKWKEELSKKRNAKNL